MLIPELSKTILFKYATDLGISIIFKAVVPPKAFLPIVVNLELSSNFTLLKFVLDEKVFSPNTLIDEGISIDVNKVLSINDWNVSVTFGACVFQSAKVIIVLVSQPIDWTTSWFKSVEVVVLTLLFTPFNSFGLLITFSFLLLIVFPTIIAVPSKLKTEVPIKTFLTFFCTKSPFKQFTNLYIYSINLLKLYQINHNKNLKIILSQNKTGV